MDAARRPRLDALAVGLLLACCGLWGLNQTVTKLALTEVPPLLQAGLRSAGAAVLLWAWSAARGIGLRPAPGVVWPGVGAGLLFAAEFGCIFIGLQHTSASRMGVLLYLAPFVVALGMPLISRGGERLGAAQWAGLLLAFGGVVLALSGGRGSGPEAPTLAGDLLALAAAVLWGGTTLLVRATPLATASPEQTLFCQVAVSGALLLAASRLAGEVWPAPALLSARAWWLLGFQIAVVTFASYLLWFWLVRHYPATQVAAFTLLTPIVGVLAGVALLGEPLTLPLVAACAAVVVGLALIQRRPG